MFMITQIINLIHFTTRKHGEIENQSIFTASVKSNDSHNIFFKKLTLLIKTIHLTPRSAEYKILK